MRGRAAAMVWLVCFIWAVAGEIQLDDGWIQLKGPQQRLVVLVPLRCIQ
jgi:hypothetical protein